MPASSSLFRRKQVYHSDLRTVSPVTLQLLNHPRDSKYPDRLPWCKFAVENEVGSFELQVENDAVRETLLGMRIGEYYTVAAAGTRDNAVLHIVGASEDVTQPYPDHPRTAAEPEASPNPPAVASGEVSLARTYFAALEAAEQIVSSFHERHGRDPSDLEHRVAACLFIDMRKTQAGARSPARGVASDGSAAGRAVRGSRERHRRNGG